MKHVVTYLQERRDFAEVVVEREAWDRAFQQLMGGDPDEAIKLLLDQLQQHEDILGNIIRADDDRGKRHVRERSRQHAELKQKMLESVAAEYNNTRVWGEDWPNRATQQAMRVAVYVSGRIEEAKIHPRPTPPLLAIRAWESAFQEFLDGKADGLIRIMIEEPACDVPILNILVARKITPP